MLTFSYGAVVLRFRAVPTHNCHMENTSFVHSRCASARNASENMRAVNGVEIPAIDVAMATPASHRQVLAHRSEMLPYLLASLLDECVVQRGTQLASHFLVRRRRRVKREIDIDHRF